jgi:hypothetical protein
MGVITLIKGFVAKQPCLVSLDQNLNLIKNYLHCIALLNLIQPMQKNKNFKGKVKIKITKQSVSNSKA